MEKHSTSPTQWIIKDFTTSDLVEPFGGDPIIGASFHFKTKDKKLPDIPSSKFMWRRDETWRSKERKRCSRIWWSRMPKKAYTWFSTAGSRWPHITAVALQHPLWHHQRVCDALNLDAQKRDRQFTNMGLGGRQLRQMAFAAAKTMQEFFEHCYLIGWAWPWEYLINHYREVWMCRWAFVCMEGTLGKGMVDSSLPISATQIAMTPLERVRQVLRRKRYITWLKRPCGQ